MSAPARYLFDLDLTVPADPDPDDQAVEEIPTIPLADHETALLGVREQAYEEGRLAGYESVEAEAARTRAVQAERIAATAEAMIGMVDVERRRIESEAIALALTAARKLAGNLVSREPLVEIESLLSECLSPLRNAPHLVLRVNEEAVEALKPITDKLAFEAGFEGRMVILGEADIATGDCRIEWADGGQVLDHSQTEATIQTLVDAYLAARQSPPANAHKDPRTGPDQPAVMPEGC